MKIAIYGKPYENELNNKIAGILDIIENRGFEPTIYDQYERFVNQEGILISG